MKVSAINLALLAFATQPLLAGATALAESAKIPASGATTYVTYYAWRDLASIDMGEPGSQAIEEMVGVTRNTDGQKVFDHMTAHCILYFAMAGGKPNSSGSSTEVDGDGDKVFTTFNEQAHTLIGGTGKYKGISGTAHYTVTMAPDVGPGQGAATVEHKVKWQIK